jgi:NADPH2:quinone reductase
MEEEYSSTKTYKVIELQKFKGALKIGERNFREPLVDEAMIKVMCSTIHPADLAYLNGTYGAVKPTLPIVPGFEGSGIIVKVGSGVNSDLIGKRCGLVGNSNIEGAYEGVWAQYCYASVNNLMIFDGEIPYETICFSIGNPLTAVGFLDTLRKKGETTVGQNGSSSSFGKIFIRLCAKEKVKTVNLVRKEEHIESLKSLGADYVFSTSSPTWEADFKNAVQDLKVTNFFECVGGNFTGKVMKLLPKTSTMYHFGNLELKRLGELDTSDFIFEKKILTGWWLSGWLQSLTKEETKYWRDFIINDMLSGSDVFTTTVSKSFSLEEYEYAFEYYLTHMSEGKVIIRPNN